MIHRHLVIEARIESTRSESRREGFLAHLVTPEYRCGRSGVVISDELLFNTREGHKR